MGSPIGGSDVELYLVVRFMFVRVRILLALEGAFALLARVFHLISFNLLRRSNLIFTRFPYSVQIWRLTVRVIRSFTIVLTTAEFNAFHVIKSIRI